MPEITVIVEFEASENGSEALTALMLQHARLTLEEEAGCLRFEVIRPLDEQGEEHPGKLIVNELYADDAAYEAHKANPRMPSVGAAAAPLLRSRRLIVARSLQTAQAAAGSIRPENLNAANDG